MTHSIWNFLLFEQNVATVNHFVVAYKVIFVWLAYHRSMLVVVQHGLIGLSGIGWACLLYFDHAGGWKCIVYNVSSFSNWAMLYFRKCNTEQLKICWSLPIFLNYFWRNAIPIYLLSLWLWLLLFTTKFISWTNSSVYNWNSLYVFSNISLYIWIICSIFLNPKLSCSQITNDRIGPSSYLTQTKPRIWPKFFILMASLFVITFICLSLFLWGEAARAVFLMCSLIKVPGVCGEKYPVQGVI